MQEVTDTSFSAEVENSEIPVVVDFWAPWCGPCVGLTPRIEKLAKEYEGKVKVVKLNVDSNSDTAARFGVRSIPTLIVFGKGEEQARYVGAREYEFYKAELDKLLV